MAREPATVKASRVQSKAAKWAAIIGGIAIIIAATITSGFGLLNSSNTATPDMNGPTTIYQRDGGIVQVGDGDINVESAAKPEFPLSASDVETLDARIRHFAFKIRRLPFAAAIYREDVQERAEQVASDPRYEERAPKVVARLYRICAATHLMDNSNPIDAVRNGLYWLSQSLQLDSSIRDFAELKEAEALFRRVAASKVSSVDAEELATHQARVAMPGASDEEVKRQVQAMLGFVFDAIRPDDSGRSPKDDYEFLAHYGTGIWTVGSIMEVQRMALKGKFPDQEVGGRPLFFRLENGNTKVAWVFYGANGKSGTWEWEVNKSKKLVIPKSDGARETMDIIANQGSRKNP